MIKKLGSKDYGYREYIALLNKCLTEKDHNSVMIGVVAVMRTLGQRKSRIMTNPVHMLSAVGQNTTILISDEKKVDGQYRYRHIPVPQEIVQMCSIMLGAGINTFYLPFTKDELVVSYDELSDGERRRLHRKHNIDGIFNVGRTAFYNFIREHGFGEVMRNSLMSHGSTQLQWNGIWSLIPYQFHIQKTAELLLPILREVGFCSLVSDLCAQLEKIEWRNFKHSQKFATLEKNHDSNRKVKSKKRSNLFHVPLSPTEETAARTIMARLRRKQSMSIADLVLSGIVELGIPLAHWIGFQHYIRYSLVLYETNTHTYWLRLPIRDYDVGGLSWYSLPLNSNMNFLKCFKLKFDRLVQKQKSIFNISDPSAIINWKVFDKLLRKEMMEEELWSSTSKQFKKLIKRNEFPDLLDRIARQKTLFAHNGPLSASLFGIKGARLNSGEFVQQISLNTGHEALLETLNGDRYINLTKKIDSKSWLKKVSKKYKLHPNKKSPGKFKGQPPLFRSDLLSKVKWIEILNKVNAPVNPDLIVKMFRLFESVLPPAEDDCNGKTSPSMFIRFKSSVLPCIIDELMIRDAIPSKTFSLIQPKNVIQMAEEIRLRTLKSFHTQTSIPQELEKLADEFVVMFLLHVIFGLRNAEAYDLKTANIFWIEKSTCIFVDHGKTNNAKRLITAGLFCENENINQYFNQMIKGLIKRRREYLFVEIRSRYKQKPKKKMTHAPRNNDSSRQLLSLWLGDICGATPHSLRHSTIYWATRDLLTKRYVRGNFWSAFFALVRQVGHGSMDMFVNEYIGTFIGSLHISVPTGGVNSIAALDGFLSARDRMIRSSS